MRKRFVLASFLAVALVAFSSTAFSQTVTSSLSGTVRDTTGAVVPNATVVLTDVATHVAQTTISNGSGFFAYAALMPGTYDLSVSMKGFATWEEHGIRLSSNESRAVPNIKLQLATTKTTVTVVSAAASPVPLATGASSVTLNNRMVSQLSIQGRDAAELIKLMPGMAINSGIANTEWNSALTQINTGPIGFEIPLALKKELLALRLPLRA